MKRFMIAVIILMAALTMGCISTETEYGTATYNPITEQTVVYVDTYEDGMHMTGKIISNNGTEVYYNLGISGYSNGFPVTGTMVGYQSSVRYDLTLHTDLGDIEIIEYVDLR